MTIAYVAQTRDHLLMLDAEGVCLHVHRRHSDLGKLAADGWDKSSKGATRCVGAQYVAALDAETEGFLVADPKLGVPMLFAKADAAGRISIIRTGPLERFEVRGSGIHERPTQRDLLGDTHPSPSIRYLPDVDDEDEPTLRFHPPKVPEPRDRERLNRSIAHGAATSVSSTPGARCDGTRGSDDAAVHAVAGAGTKPARGLTGSSVDMPGMGW